MLAVRHPDRFLVTRIFTRTYYWGSVTGKAVGLKEAFLCCIMMVILHEMKADGQFVSLEYLWIFLWMLALIHACDFHLDESHCLCLAKLIFYVDFLFIFLPWHLGTPVDCRQGHRKFISCFAIHFLFLPWSFTHEWLVHRKAGAVLTSPGPSWKVCFSFRSLWLRFLIFPAGSGHPSPTSWRASHRHGRAS